jgi:D-alanine-D-alanine ligase
MSVPPGTIFFIRSLSTHLRRVLLVYNTDYDEELRRDSPIDVSAVQAAAMAVYRAAGDYGFECEIMGLQGLDLDRLLSRMMKDPPDLVFNLCESLNGDTRNELVVPAVLDMLKVPYTGPGPLTIGLCLDKARTKEVLLHSGVPTPEHRVVRSLAELDVPGDPLGLDRLVYPQFIKLLREDASIGIEASNMATSRQGLVARVRDLMVEHRQPVLIERYVEGREVNVTVLGNGADARVLPLHEIDFAKLPAGRPRVLTYAAKWDEKHVDYIGTVPVPMAGLRPELEEAIGAVALKSFHALGLSDYGRVDMRLDADDVPWVIDVNPNCDLSPDAGLPRTARSIGLDYPQIIGRICELAWRRHGREHPRAQAQ